MAKVAAVMLTDLEIYRPAQATISRYGDEIPRPGEPISSQNSSGILAISECLM